MIKLDAFFVLHWGDYAGNQMHYAANQKTARQPFHTPWTMQWSKEHFLLSISRCLSQKHTHTHKRAATKLDSADASL